MVIVKKTHSVPLLLLVCVTGLFLRWPALCDAAPLGAEELGRQKIHNCGLAVAVFALKYYRASVDIPSLALELDVGSHWERPATMLSLKEVLKRKGVSVDALMDAEVGDILRLELAGKLLVIHTEDHRSSRGHYLVVARSERGPVLVVDAGRWYREISAEEFGQEFGGSLTGFCLLLGPRGSTPTGAIPLDGRAIRINLGAVPGHQGQILAATRVSNRTSETLVLSDWRGTCRCIRDVRFHGDPPESIGPGDERVLDIAVEAGAFVTGPGPRRAFLSFSGPVPFQTLVEIHADKGRGDGRSELAWFPEEIDYGLLSVTEAAAPQNVIVSCPPGVAIKEVRESSPILEVTRLGCNRDRHGQRLYRFRIAVREDLRSSLRESVEFVTTNDQLPAIVIPVTAALPSAESTVAQSP